MTAELWFFVIPALMLAAIGTYNFVTRKPVPSPWGWGQQVLGIRGRSARVIGVVGWLGALGLVTAGLTFRSYPQVAATLFGLTGFAIFAGCIVAVVVARISNDPVDR